MPVPFSLSLSFFVEAIICGGNVASLSPSKGKRIINNKTSLETTAVFPPFSFARVRILPASGPEKNRVMIRDCISRSIEDSAELGST